MPDSVRILGRNQVKVGIAATHGIRNEAFGSHVIEIHLITKLFKVTIESLTG